MYCPPSRPGRCMVFVQMEEYSWSRWDVWHAFIHGWESHARCKLRVYLHVSCRGLCSPAWHPSWHLSPCVSLIIIIPQQGVPTCLSTRGEQSRKTARTLHNIILRMQAHFMLWEQFIGPSFEAMRTPVIGPLQCYGNTAPLSYHLPYTQLLVPSFLEHSPLLVFVIPPSFLDFPAS